VASVSSRARTRPRIDARTWVQTPKIHSQERENTSNYRCSKPNRKEKRVMRAHLCSLLETDFVTPSPFSHSVLHIRSILVSPHQPHSSPVVHPRPRWRPRRPAPPSSQPPPPPPDLLYGMATLIPLPNPNSIVGALSPPPGVNHRLATRRRPRHPHCPCAPPPFSSPTALPLPPLRNPNSRQRKSDGEAVRTHRAVEFPKVKGVLHINFQGKISVHFFWRF
jgi:hypothetical protein